MYDGSIFCGNANSEWRSVARVRLEGTIEMDVAFTLKNWRSYSAVHKYWLAPRHADSLVGAGISSLAGLGWLVRVQNRVEFMSVLLMFGRAVHVM